MSAKTRKGKGKQHERLPTGPTPEEWAQMKRYGSFSVSDGPDNKYMFGRGQTATILPSHIPPGTDTPEHEYWVGKILDVRAFEHDDDDTNEVWVRVQWYYSAEDVQGVIKSFPSKTCGRYERVLSDHYDIVTPQAFNESVTVAALRDDDPQQIHIGRHSFFTRYDIERKTRRAKPKPGADSCICNKPYSPDDTSDASSMHFCPRPKCRRWFHQRCILARTNSSSPKKKKNLTQDNDNSHPNFKLTKDAAALPCSAVTRKLRLLATSPDDDEAVCLSDLIPNPPAKRMRRSSTASGGGGREPRARSRSDASDPAVRSAIAALPPSLVAIAEQPIVRGALYERGGVSGNVRAVVEARRLVYAALRGDDLPDDWEDVVLGEIASSTLDGARVTIVGMNSVPPLVCPQCSSAI